MRIIDDPQFEPDEDATDVALDQLLLQARWPEPTPDVRQRVQSQWRAISRRRRIAPAIWCVIGAAAAVVLIVTSWMAISLLNKSRTIEFVEGPVGTDVKYLSVGAPMQSSASVPSRPANLLEQLSVLAGAPAAPASVAVEVQPPLTTDPNVALLRSDDPRDLAAFLAHVSDQSQRDAALEALKGMFNPPLDRLANRLTSPSLDERFAAADALASLDDPRVIEILREKAERDPGRREALVALSLSGSPLAAKALAGMELAPSTRAQLLADQGEIRSQQARSTSPRS